jgi:Holliday junction DNA helicase RuvA
MITHLIGTLEHVENDHIVIDVAGVGYRVNVPTPLTEELPKIGQKVKVHTYLYVQENALTLYGFQTKEERSLFTLLLTVSGVGPKGALSLLSALRIDQLVVAITKGNVDLLTSTPGIGSKTAQRIIIELKEKIGKAYAIEKGEIIRGLPGEEPILKDAVSALMTLGYSPREARQAILNAGIDLTEKIGIEEIIKKALKVLS